MTPRQNPPKKKWLLRTPSADAAARLFCFPYSGVGASLYSRWPDRVGPAEICRIQLPGRENRVREEHFGTYEGLADELVEALLPYLDRPFGFFGHCGGALAAFATAHRLAELGLPVPDQFFVSSQVAPHEGPYGRYLSMDETELRKEMERLTRLMGAEPVPDLIDLGLGVMTADLAANRAYRTPEPVVLPTRIRLLGWRDDREVDPELMTGWAACAPAGQCERKVLPGDHHAFLRAPGPLVDELTEGMAAAVAAAASD